jgi:nitrile hydratase
MIPQRSPGTDALDEEALAGLVTRDAMIGVGVPGTAAAPRENAR